MDHGSTAHPLASSPTQPTAPIWYLIYERPGGGDDAWVTRVEADGEVSNPEDIHFTLGPDDAIEAKEWATAELATRGVLVTGWTRLPYSEWETHQAEVDQ